jgi:hypothetical protein
MTQLLDALRSLHENNFIFPVGELTEEIIFLNLMCSECYLDAGFLKIEGNPDFKVIPPELNEKMMEKKSKLTDIFSLGIIFLRLVTFLSFDKIKNLFKTPEVDNGGISSPISGKGKPLMLFQKKKKEKDIFGEFYSSFNIQSFTEVEAKIFTELSKCKAHDEIKKIVFEMLRPAEKRPKIKDALIRLNTLKGIFEKQDIDGVVSQFKTFEESPILEAQVKQKKSEDAFSLIGFLSDSELRPYFHTFLQTEFAEEPMVFLIEVEKYKLKKDDRASTVSEIYKNFIDSSTAKYEINVTHKLKKLFSKDMDRQISENIFQDDLFDALLNHVVGRSLQEPFFRFKSTQKFKDIKKKYM